jgi:hypothetical protein
LTSAHHSHSASASSQSVFAFLLRHHNLIVICDDLFRSKPPRPVSLGPRFDVVDDIDLGQLQRLDSRFQVRGLHVLTAFGVVNQERREA